MIVLLTGATGFIGSHVARELIRRGHEVHAAVRRDSDRRRIHDLETSLHICEGFIDTVPVTPDVTIHLAWYAVPGLYLEAPENMDCLNASRRLLEKIQGRVLCAGTCFEYDTRIGWLTEGSATNPTTLYAVCKDVLRKDVVERPNAVWMRFFYQYGPWEDPRRMIPAAVRAILQGDVVRTSPGEQRRDFLYIDDVARAVCMAAESRLEGPLNIGSGIAYPVREIVTTIGKLGGRPDLIRLGAVGYYEGEPMLVGADVGKLRSTGWTPEQDLEEGLRRTVDWWKQEVRSAQVTKP